MSFLCTCTLHTWPASFANFSEPQPPTLSSCLYGETRCLPDHACAAPCLQKHPSVVPFLLYIKNEAKHIERMAVRAKYMTLVRGVSLLGAPTSGVRCCTGATGCVAHASLVLDCNMLHSFACKYTTTFINTHITTATYNAGCNNADGLRLSGMCSGQNVYHSHHMLCCLLHGCACRILRKTSM